MDFDRHEARVSDEWLAPPFKKRAPAPTGRNSIEIQTVAKRVKKVTPNKFSLSVHAHDAFGALATLTLPGQPRRRFTLQEASIVAKAIEAVALGRSLERQIYMSPIASDYDFEAHVSAEGMTVACDGFPALFLNWADSAALACGLKEATRTE
jgi:hypothetical protein